MKYIFFFMFFNFNEYMLLFNIEMFLYISILNFFFIMFVKYDVNIYVCLVVLRMD